MSDKKDLNEFAPAAVPIASTVARFGAGQMIKTGALAAGAAAAFSPKVRKFASHALGLDKTPEQSTASLNKAGEKLGIATPATPASSTPSSGGSASTPTNKPEAPKPAAADKPVTYDKNKYAIYNKDSSSAKSFRDTFAAQKAAGASEFKWKGGDNVERSYSTKSAPEIKPADVPLPPSRPTDLNKPEFESGGKKKKMSEETNPLITAFLKLQETKAANMFEAAKKAKKDYDKDGKVESPKDEVWGSRFRAAKAAGKMEEGSMMDPNDPSVQGGSDVTSSPAKKAPVPKMPTAPKTDSSVQGSSDVTSGGKPVRVKEETQIDEVETIQESTRSLGALAAEMYHHASIGHYGENEDMSHKQIKKHVDAFHAKKAAIAAKHGPEVAHAVAHHAEQMAHHDNSSFAHIDEKEHPNFVKKYLGGAGSKQHQIYKRTLSNKGYDGAHQDDLVESVSFSQAEIDHLNSFFEAVAPSRAEPTKGVNPSVSNTSLTDETLEELEKKTLKSYVGKVEKRGETEKRSEGLYRAQKGIAKQTSSKTLDAKVKKLGSTPMSQMKHDFEYDASREELKNRGIHHFAGRRTRNEEVEQIEEGRPKKNPTPEVTERDPRQHIQVIAGRAAAGNTLDFPHNDGSKSKITPAMGRKITSHLQGLKPADRQAAVNKMHASSEGLKV